jgi:hypothetical protein
VCIYTEYRRKYVPLVLCSERREEKRSEEKSGLAASSRQRTQEANLAKTHQESSPLPRGHPFKLADSCREEQGASTGPARSIKDTGKSPARCAIGAPGKERGGIDSFTSASGMYVESVLSSGLWNPHRKNRKTSGELILAP